MFFDKPFEQQIAYRACISHRYFENINIAAPVLRLRNVLIWLTVIEIFASIWGFSYYFIRRSMIYIVINTSALILSGIGIYSTIFLNEIGLILYSLVIILSFNIIIIKLNLSAYNIITRHLLLIPNIRIFHDYWY